MVACAASAGQVTVAADCNDGDAAVNPSATELCNGVDDNCDGTVDEGLRSTFYADTDGDRYGDASAATSACSTPAGYVVDATDCDDTSASVYPGAPEVCDDGIDQDCDGVDALRVSFCDAPPTDATFSDVFDTEDATRWGYGDWTVGDTRLDASQVTDAGGLLGIALTDTGAEWVGGELYRLDEVAYGQITACVAGPDAPGSVGAFFLYAQHMDGAQEVHDEIDVELVNGSVQIGTFADWRLGVDGYEDGPRRDYEWWTPPEGVSTVDFHAYTVDWSPDAVRFLFDGVEIGSLAVTPATALSLRFNHWTTTAWTEVMGPPASSPLHLHVDWVTWEE